MKITNKMIEKNIRNDLKFIHGRRNARNAQKKYFASKKYLACVASLVLIISLFAISYSTLAAQARIVNEEINIYNSDMPTKPDGISEAEKIKILENLDAKITQINDFMTAAISIFVFSICIIFVIGTVLYYKDRKHLIS